MDKSINISIAGIMGSGKTTLAKKLAAKLNWDYIPESLAAKRYLQDLFSETKRWALETQFGFLVNKATTVLAQIKKNRNFILDRTFLEDIEIFAKYFYDNGYIDFRGYDTYKSLADHYLSIIPPPDLIIFCECNLTTAEIRIKNRNRDFQKLYPPNHLEEIYVKYKGWLQNVNNVPFYCINSERYDFREDNIVKTIIDELISIFSSRPSQYQIFERGSEPELKLLVEKTPYFSEINKQIVVKKLDLNVDSLPFPYAYIAAPFTSIAQVPINQKNKLELFDTQHYHGVIPSGDVIRQLLLNIAKVLRGWGINSIIPHRDVNEWGKKQLMPVEVFDKCTSHIKNCDLFIGLLGESLGSHIEYGIALGQSKPSIIIDCTEINSSFISQGITNETDKTIVLKCEKIKDIPNQLSKIKFSEIIKSF